MRRAIATATALVLAAVVIAGCGGGSKALHLPFRVTPLGTSWVTGQQTLASVPGYRAIEGRAVPLGEQRWSAYQDELAAIQAARLRAQKRARADALRRYEEAKRRAERLYKEALRKAAEARKKQQELLRKARLKRERELRALLRKLRIKPGQECSLPEVQAQFHCLPGRYPLRKAGK